MGVPHAYTACTEHAQEAAADFDIRCEGKGYDEIDLVFGFDGLLREQCEVLCGYLKSTEAAAEKDLLTQCVRVHSSGTSLLSDASEQWRQPGQ